MNDASGVQLPILGMPQKYEFTELVGLSSCFHGIWNTLLHLLIPSLSAASLGLPKHEAFITLALRANGPVPGLTQAH